MGKKVKKQIEAVPEPQVQVEEVEAQEPVQKKESLQKYLPHNKFIAKKTKQHIRIKKEALAFIKLDKHQINSAVKSLKEFVQRTKNVMDLFQGGNQGFIYLQVDLAQVPVQHSVRPIQVPLPVPIYSEKYNSRFSVFSSDPEQDYIKHIQNLNLPLLSEVVGYERAKKHFRNNKDKLALLNGNDMFFCDWKIYNLLRKPLGKLFYEKKKYPYPIDCETVPEHLTQKYDSYESYVNDLINSSYTMLGNGPVYTLKVGRFDMSNAELVKNIMQATFRFLPYILEEVGVDQVRQISIKGFNSPSLPIYNYIAPKDVEIYQKNKGTLKEVEESKEE